MQNKLEFNKIIIQPVITNRVPQNISLDVLRLDQIHPVISGNKWFKLKYYLAEAQQTGYNTLATFGGAYSNHIIAVAFACHALGLKSMGIIRGEQPAKPSQTLLYAAEYGMQLQFVSRDEFKNKQAIQQQYNNVYWVNEGGYGSPGAKGAGEILSLVPNVEKYTHIVCAVGTGTMLAGIINSAQQHQKVTGISVLKNNFSIIDEVIALLNDKTAVSRFEILHGYHFGGYARHPAELIDFMRQTWNTAALPTDIVYTAKTLHAIYQLMANGAIAAGSRVLMVHSGGLQGNTSLQKGLLPF